MPGGALPMFYIKYMSALIYDVFILFALFLIFTALCLGMRQGRIIPAGSLWYQLSLATITYLYYSLSYQCGGQTIGMRAWRIQLISTTTSLKQKHLIARFLLTIPAVCYAIMRFKKPGNYLTCWTKTQVISLNRP